jgi:streptogramin lyase
VNQSANVVSANCSSLFSAATPSGGTPPTNTIQVALNMAKNPTLNLATITNLVAATGTPYQPSMGSNVPNSWTIAISYTPTGIVTPKGIAADANGNLWIPNSGNNTVTELSTTGAVVSGSGYGVGLLNVPSAIAIDINGQAWVTNSGNNTVTQLSASGTTGNTYSGGGLNGPMGIAIDYAGDVWVSNSGNSTVSEFASTGAAISTTSGYSGGGLNKPVALAIGSN